MTFRYDLVANRHPHSGTLADRFGGKEGIKNALLNRFWYSSSIVANMNPDLLC